MAEESKMVALEKRIGRLEKAIKSLLLIASASIDFKTFSGLSKITKEGFEE